MSTRNLIHSVLACAAALFLTFQFMNTSNTAQADSWAVPKLRIYASQSGKYGFIDQLKKGYLFTLDKNAKMKTVWEGPLQNIPINGYISNLGHLVTLDNYASVGYNHVLVIYSPTGQLLADYKLTDLLTSDEITKHTTNTVSSRWWRNNVPVTFNNNATIGYIKLKWGKTITFNLKNGHLIKDNPKLN